MVWIISFMHVYVCLLASMLYIHVFLSRSRLCHALCPPWDCVCRSLRPLTSVVAFVPVVDRYHLWDTPPWCGCAWYTPFSTLYNADMLACSPCATCLAFFASLHLCTLAYMFMHESVCRPYYNSMELWTQSKPTFVLLGHPLLFDNMLVCPCLASFASFSFSMLSFYFVSLLVC